MKKINVIGSGVTVCDYDSVIEEIIRMAKTGDSHAVTASATHLIIEAWRSDKLRERINRFDIVTPDGHPVYWALNLLGNAGLDDKVTGPDLTLRLCKRAAESKIKIYFYGSTEQVVTTLRDRLVSQNEGLEIAGIKPSWFRAITEEEDLRDIADINESGARICFVGLGCPRQENWAYEHLGKVNAVMICVGAAFDFHAGLLARAPDWMQKYGLEWLFRVIKEPRRLALRYGVNNPLYLFLLFMQWAGLASFPIKKRKKVSISSD